MADVQLENGYTKIVNELLDALISAELLGSELQVCLFVIRKTYGYNKTEDEISLTQFEQALRKSRPTIVKAIKNLQLVNILKLVKRGNSRISSNTYKLNKDYDSWKLVKIPELVKSKDTTSKVNAKKLVKVPLHTKDNTKDNTKEIEKKEIQKKEKENGEKRKRFIPPSTEEVIKYCMERGNSVNPHAFLDFYQSKNWMIGKNKMKDWRAAIRTWEQRDSGNNGTQRASPQPTTYRQAQDLERRKLAQLLKEDRKRGGFADNSKGVSQAGAHLPEPTKGSG